MFAQSSRILVAVTCALTATHMVRATSVSQPFGNNVCLRGDFQNARTAFERTGKGTVAFLGGSITEMNGYRPMVCDLLRKRFPKTVFTFIPAGISSTCSTTGAFRLGTDVLGTGPVDLLFVEFAVNDDQDGHHSREECIRGMEGIIRHTRQINPATDIVMTFFVNEYILKTLKEGKTPLTIDAHSAVAEHYAIPTIHLAKEVAEEITAGKLTWEKYGGVHPAPFGNAICAQMIDELFNRAWAKPLAKEATVTPNLVPLTPLDPLNYSAGRFIDLAAASIKQGWTLGIPDWKNIKGNKRTRFTSIPMLSATDPGAEFTLAFEGTAVGAFVVAGPDAGILETSVDGGPTQKIDVCHAYSKELHYPRTVMFATALEAGPHTLTVRVSADTNSEGHAVRIMHFAAN